MIVRKDVFDGKVFDIKIKLSQIEYTKIIGHSAFDFSNVLWGLFVGGLSSGKKRTVRSETMLVCNENDDPELKGAILSLMSI